MPVLGISGCEHALGDWSRGRPYSRNPSVDNTYAKLPETFYTELNPTPFHASPCLVPAIPEAAALISLDPEEATRPEFAQVFGGSLLVPGMEAYAAPSPNRGQHLAVSCSS